MPTSDGQKQEDRGYLCRGLHVFCPTSKSTQPYQRERASITGLRFKLRKIMQTGRLIGVAVSRLVSHSSSSQWSGNRKLDHGLSFVLPAGYTRSGPSRSLLTMLGTLDVKSSRNSVHQNGLLQCNSISRLLQLHGSHLVSWADGLQHFGLPRHSFQKFRGLSRDRDHSQGIVRRHSRHHGLRRDHGSENPTIHFPCDL